MVAAVSSRPRKQIVVAAVALCLLAAQPCLAQAFEESVFNYFIPLKTIESVTGPIFPSGGLGSTFRSEFLAGVSAAEITAVKLQGANGMERELREFSHLDQAPLRFDLAANLRCWRFGLRGKYSNFTARSKFQNLASLEITGLNAGADFDVVNFPWLAIGAAFDVSLYEPRFKGLVRDTFWGDFFVDVSGEKPSTVGCYIRYIPPEILNCPVHVEAYYNTPFKGSRKTSFGIAASFRPQIYRFDLACKLYAEKTFLNFKTPPDTQFDPFPPGPPLQQWRMELEWANYGLDFAVYF